MQSFARKLNFISLRSASFAWSNFSGRKIAPKAFPVSILSMAEAAMADRDEHAAYGRI